MKRVVFFFATLMISLGAFGFTPDQYATQVIQKDLPRSIRWFGKMATAQNMGQVEVYELYQAALPETQVNQQLGISVKGSVERMILLLDGVRYYDQIQQAPVDYQNKKEVILRILQTAKDEMDRFQYGEDPQVLLDEWKSLGVNDIAKFTADLVETFTETQRLLNTPVVVPVEQKVDAQAFVPSEEMSESVERVDAEPLPENSAAVTIASSVEVEPAATPFEVIAPTPTPNPMSFEDQRFSSYIQNVEAGKIAGECQNAILWKTDQAESCQSDDTLECDRSYARQCKKLQ